MSTFEEVQREERKLREMEETRIDEERQVKRLQEAWDVHFMKSRRFLDKLCFQFHKNDRNQVFEQLSTELRHQSRQVMAQLEEDAVTLRQQKRKVQRELDEVAIRKRQVLAEEDAQ